MKYQVATAVVIVVLAVCSSANAQTVTPQQPVSTAPTVSPEATAQMVSKLIADAIPREYERKKDWGKTKEIVTGVRSSGNFFKFDIHRTRSTVNDGVWKHYRATMIEPDKNLVVRMENLRSVAAGKIAFTLFVTAKLHGWGRAKVYEHGVHLIALEAESDAKVSLWLDCEIALEAAPSSFFTGIAVRPVVTGARMTLDEFQLTRVSDVSGPVVRELGDGIRRLIEDELNGPKLAGKINRSIEKRKDRLVFTPEILVGATGAPSGAGTRGEATRGASSAAK